ncbi:zinc-binding dehydrogenase [Cryptosporangium minutisporangium]|uniref:Zinc-binding dehydrogenase n=2 Tax=Cryptosporangium minutisporangium TaxID=113569 RepID=A0ABP6T3N8_9ACTN
MRALQQTSFHGPKDMRLITDAPVPTPGPGEVLIRVAAAGVNFADVTQTYGRYRGGPQPPYLAGFEGAGEVVASGGDVTGVEIGQHVLGTGYGAFAEYLVLPASTAVAVPDGWDDHQALGLVLNWGTALAALRPLGRLEPGETVVIHAAAGGVGQAAVRAAKNRGAVVIAAASMPKHDVVRALGADHVVDPGRSDLAAQVRELTSGRGADLVLESVGGATFAASLAAARPVTGRVVVYGLAAGEASVTNHQLVFDHQVQVIGLHIGVLGQVAPDMFAEVMAEVDALRTAGVVVPGHPAAYDLEDGPDVLARLEARATTGKLVLRP